MPKEANAGTSAENPMVATSSEVKKPPQVLDHPKLRETGNGASVSYEEALLREYFGEPDEDGVYR